MTQVAIKREWDLADVQVRTTDTGDTLERVFSGHASVFNTSTLIGSRTWGFLERIAPGAFDNVLEDDVRFLVNHTGLPLARTTNGTLRLSVDEVGLYNEATLANTQQSRDLAVLLERGDVTQQSFAFRIAENGFEWRNVEFEGETIKERTITKMARLYDTSVVTFPAYPSAKGGLIRSQSDEIDDVMKELVGEAEAKKQKRFHERLTVERLAALRRQQFRA